MSTEAEVYAVALTVPELRTVLGWAAVVENEGLHDEDDLELAAKLRELLRRAVAPKP